ncbi:MAG: hypothetical protein K8I02_11170, partial [Candidatus Methylomirabilis sp.]|nr:hypothetical protein [Deltaproteobacteria bacterium]
MKDRKNVLIAALVAALVGLGAVVAWDRLPEEIKARLGGREPARVVKVFDVALDRDGLRFVDLVFDRPLGEGKTGHVLEREPATIRPKIEGVWKWRDAFALRFEPQGPFAKATEYEIELRADRLLPPGERFEKESVAFATDRFKVARVNVAEEPAADASGGVVLRGRVEFNYPVDPDHLVSKMRLIDPLAGEARPVPIGVDIHYWSDRITSRS